jgi:hypothetical protein
MLLFIKVITSALIITIATELARQNKFLAAIIISLPLISLISFVWIYIEQKNTENLAVMSMEVFWLMLASIPFFPIFSYMLKAQYGFWVSLGVGLMALMVAYVFIISIKSWLPGGGV